MILFFRLIIIILFKMSTPKNDFQKLNFNHLDFRNILLNNISNSDDNFLKTNQFSDSNYFATEKKK